MVLKIARCLPLAAALLLMQGCYYMQALNGQWAVMNQRQSIDRVLARPSTPDALKQQLTRAKRVRDFASRELGLPDNASYRSYADIGRPYVVWNVVAAPELSIEPLQWCFPIVGCLAYRGYFREATARDLAARLKKQGNDVMVGGVPAYSTLGHIDDPLLSTVARYSELDMAELVFHELAHQVAYLQGDTGWNEAFATAVEEEGVARYAARFLNPQALADWQKLRQVREELVALFVTARQDLGSLYRQGIAPEAMRAGKQERLTRLAADIQVVEQRASLRSGYRSWMEAGLNNAHLSLIATYHDLVPHFAQLLKERCADDLPCFYARAKEEIATRKSKPLQ